MHRRAGLAYAILVSMCKKIRFSLILKGFSQVFNGFSKVFHWFFKRVFTGVSFKGFSCVFLLQSSRRRPSCSRRVAILPSCPDSTRQRGRSMSNASPHQLCFETLSGWWRDGLRSNFLLRRLRDGGGAMAGRWRDGGGTVCVPTFFATLVGRWQDGFAFGIHTHAPLRSWIAGYLVYLARGRVGRPVASHRGRHPSLRYWPPLR